MRYPIRLLIAGLCIWPLLSTAQVDPPEGAVLNYTQVMLEAEPVLGASEYVFEWSFGVDGAGQARGKAPAHRLDDLRFDEAYTWTCQALGPDGRLIRRQGPFHFRTQGSPMYPERQRFRIQSHDPFASEEGLIFLDYSRVAINRKGKVVWYLPARRELGGARSRLRDMKLTHRGTLTFMPGDDCLETDLAGNVLWKAPEAGEISSDTAEYYHHEFTALRNGNYMVLGKRIVPFELQKGNLRIDKITYAVLAEIDPQGNLVWIWSTERYVQVSDLLAVGDKVFRGNTFGHANSFYFDESRDLICLGFRDLSSIIFLRRSDGETILTVGDKLPSDSTRQGVGLFRKQHAGILTREGQLLLYNNDQKEQDGGTGISSVQILSLPLSDQDSVRKLWEFTCDFDTLSDHFSDRMGNALLQENGNILVNMGAVARTFEVTRDKQVVWDCFPEVRDSAEAPFRPQSNYRSFFAPDLYPNRQALSATFLPSDTGNRLEYELGIHNVGHGSDHYHYRVYGMKRGKQKLLAEGESPEVPGRDTYHISLSIKAPGNFDSLVFESVSSQNPQLIRQMSILPAF